MRAGLTGKPGNSGTIAFLRLGRIKILIYRLITYSDVQFVPDISRKSNKSPIFGLAKSPVPNHVIKLLHFAP
jgi:hypothetical protein